MFETSCCKRETIKAPQLKPEVSFASAKKKATARSIDTAARKLLPAAQLQRHQRFPLCQVAQPAPWRSSLNNPGILDAATNKPMIIEETFFVRAPPSQQWSGHTQNGRMPVALLQRWSDLISKLSWKSIEKLQNV
jgi:hypothetical protein